MADKRRGLLTETERAVLLGETDVTENYYYTVVSRIRSKIDELETDMEALSEHEELLRELQEVVCTDDD